MHIGSINVNQTVVVVAEIGNNHEGDIALAEQLVRAAADSGADAVKFQTFRTEHYVSRSDTARYERLKRFELQHAHFESLAALARSLGLLFIATPFDLHSAAELEPLVDAYKIASGDNTFYPLLDAVAATGKPLLISSGFSNLGILDRAVARVNMVWQRKGLTGSLALLHCVGAYPTPPDQANVLAIDVLAARYGCPVGYSDHTIGLDAAVVAVARGARIIEKHFTLDKNYSDFRDHQLSADPAELRELVTRIRAARLVLGSGDKQVQACEAPALAAVRRSIVAAADLPAGHVLEWGDLTWTRPAAGLPPGDEDELLGRPLIRSVTFGEALTGADVGAPAR
ncbi:MAG TPA: N-acetylneuraminate synthase family protein [Acidobacteriota bacterium]|jgi:sialic acid synthase SpsE|nr:N-acetylneuraminate synthase family protein [Acidobacteriota bacterium]